ncbi:hypothetical protein [Streptomyces sp. GQFP]|uniref:hypothetical protein n=1 Tax=Streptomyces sp. GQFP TaxID=2907545 RepID=UPI001F1ACBE4|nr:hypothetical protein [Streptomyces sp. GQFP]UIX32477.1 hypothetical protein LUX31_21915 [Streptomyces sp. GQFP]
MTTEEPVPLVVPLQQEQQRNVDLPGLLAEQLALGPADFSDMSCTGATIADLTSPQSTDNGVNRAQLSALSDETRLVTIGIGGPGPPQRPRRTRHGGRRTPRHRRPQVAQAAGAKYGRAQRTHPWARRCRP